MRSRALRSFRTAVLVLLVPALYNYSAFDAHAIARLPAHLANLYRTVNIGALLLGGGLIWFLGMPMLEAIARFVWRWLAKGADRIAWDEVLYRTLNWTFYLAVPGAALWMIWVFGLYQMKIDFYVISWVVGIPAHLLGACLYLPLIYGWYRLAASPPAG